VRGAWLTHPWWNLAAALRAWGQQLLTFGSGSGVGADIWRVTSLAATVRQHFPGEADALAQAIQYRTDLDLRPLSRLHQGVLGLFLLAGVWLWVRHRRLANPAAAWLGLLILAALVNAGVTAIFSNPDDRYQARLVWLFIPAVLFLYTHLRPRCAPGAADSRRIQ
jgi:hypothetical protein